MHPTYYPTTESFGSWSQCYSFLIGQKIAGVQPHA